MGYLKLSNFRGQAGPVISRRGREYWEEGRVEIVESDGKKFVATVRGTEDYITTAQVDGDEILNLSCTCPYGRGICKHEVALLLEIKNRMSKEKTTKEIIKEKLYEIEGEQVSEKEFFLLTSLACSDGFSIRNLGYHSVPVGKGWKSTTTERNKLLEKLSRQGFLERYYASYYDLEYRVKESKKYLIIKNTVVQRPDWITYLDKEYYLSEPSRYIIQITEMITGKRSTITTPYPGVNTELVCLKYAVIQEDKEKILKVFDPSFLLLLLNTLCVEALEYGYQNYLEKIEDILFSISERTKDWDIAEHHLRLATLYSKGQLLPVSNPQTASSYLNYIEAVISLYKGDLDASIQSFQKGLSLKKGGKLWKIIPIESISFLLYVTALGLRRQDKDILTLQKINSYSSHKDCTWLRPLFTLADFFSSPSQPKNNDLLLNFIKGTSNCIPSVRDICVLLLRFFQQSDSNPGHFPYTLTTSHSVLLHEISAFGEEKTVQNWPWEPALLAQIKPKEFWELELQDILRIATASTKLGKTAEGKEATGRLAYVVSRYFNEYTLVDIRQQNRLKNGAWSKGKKLPYIHYQEGDMQMDSSDTQIYEIWKKQNFHSSYYRDFSNIEVLLPYLKGTDKLAMESSNGLINIYLKEEIPFIYTRRDNSQIIFESNLPEKAQYLETMVLDVSSKSEWVYYPISKENRDLVYRILELKAVPESAEPMLEKLFELLKGQVEIHSEIAGSTQIEKCQAQEKLTLRISPEGGNYRAVLQYRPLEEGAKVFFPATGDKIIFDSKDGKRFEVKRNLRKEAKALRELNLLLPGNQSFSLRQTEICLELTELLALVESRLEHPELFDIEWLEGQPFALKEAQAEKWNISAKSRGGWFELEGEVKLAENKIVSLAKLLEMMRESPQGFVKLSEDMYLHLGESLRKQLQRIDSLAQASGNKLRVNKLAMAVSGESLQGDMEIAEPEALVELRQKIRESERMEVEIPDSLNAQLRDYQEDGVRWILRMANWGAGVCLADDMGLGKTVQSIACMLSRKDRGAQLVVAPASVLGNWRKETNRFAPLLNTVVLNELSLEDRSRAIAEARESDLLILSYGLLNTMSESLSTREWASICLDEAHTIKNRDTKTSSAAMLLKSDERIILTGTPIQNHLGELWNLFQFINPGLLGSYEHFNQRFIAPIAAGSQEVKSQLKRLISPFILRRTKQEVAKELPDKEEIILPVSLSEEEMSVYEILRREAKSELEASSVLSVNTLAMITKLREAACCVSLVEKGMQCGSSKLAVMTDKLLQILEQGNRVLVFSQFTSFLDLACKELEASGVKEYYYLNGSTPLKEREKMVEAFQRGDKKVFFISLKAGGLGLNLTGANYVIHLDPWWNPAIESQATDRAYRIGQKEKVTVYHLISEHTIEEKILRLHQSKRSLADSLLDGTSLSGKLSVKELLEMIEG